MARPSKPPPPWRVEHGDCLALMAKLAPSSVDAIVTDPPYDLTAGKKGGSGEASVNLESPYGRARITTGFMGKSWDGTGVAFDPATWRAALRVAKPGAHLVAFGGTRTHHRLMVAIEDAGWEIRDCLMWIFGSGFPKSLNLPGGIGTALKPAYEPIVLARRPLVGTVAANVAEHGTGALNIDATRIAGPKPKMGDRTETVVQPNAMSGASTGRREITGEVDMAGRWPANLVLDQDAAALLDEQAGECGQAAPVRGTEPTANGFSGPVYGDGLGCRAFPLRGDSGGPSRFFYTAKAGREERERGLDHRASGRVHDGRARQRGKTERTNTHPTVKPLDLMRWLVRLVAPPASLVLDPFTGSGTTGMACMLEGLRFLGMEQDGGYCDLARDRILAGLEQAGRMTPAQAGKTERPHVQFGLLEWGK